MRFRPSWLAAGETFRKQETNIAFCLSPVCQPIDESFWLEPGRYGRWPNGQMAYTLVKPLTQQLRSWLISAILVTSTWLLQRQMLILISVRQTTMHTIFRV